MFPATGPAAHDAPPVATQVQEAEATCGNAVIASVTVAPVTSEGPALATASVYVTGDPGVYVVAPSVLVIDRSAALVPVSVSVALSAPGPGSDVPEGGATVAVLTRF